MAANENRQKLIHLHKSTSGSPATSDLNFGEIAVNHSIDKPALYIKNNDGIIEFLPATAITQISKIYADGLIDALDVSAQTIAYVTSGDNVIIYPTITEDDGKILISGDPITLAKVAKTGNAADISIDDTNDNFSATTVEGALAELVAKVSFGTTIDGEGGVFTTGNGIDDVTSENKVLSVKVKDNDYISVDSTGVQLDSSKIDSSYETGTTGNLATVGTVKSAIEDLDTDGFRMLDVVASAQNETTLIVRGIKEVDGKIELDSPTNDFAILVDGQYNNTTNKLATEHTVFEAISGLDVTAITGSANQTITSVSEEDGKISATYSDISITKSQISDLGDLDSLYAPKSLSGTVETLNGKIDTLIGSDSGKSVRTIANEELVAQLIPATAQESLDTLQEIADWIQQHPDDASAMNTAITSLSAVSASTRLSALETSTHTHENKSTLDTISAEKVTAWDGAVTNSHTHSNQSLLDTYTQTEANLADAVDKKHEHSNKSVLDGITAEKVAGWDAASADTHTHENKEVIDAITAEKVAGWDAASADSHTHSNKALLDTYTQTEANLAAAVASAHNHTNATVLDGITAEKVAGWDAASADSHTHTNKSIIDDIDQTDIDKWNASVTGATGDTYVAASVADNVVTVSSTTAATNVFTNAVLGVNNTSSATSANVTVDSTSKLLDFSNMSIDCGEY
jgi:hypothetical protein